MNQLFCIGLLSVLAFATPTWAKAWRCSVSCYFETNKLLGSKNFPGYDEKQQLDFKAYCDDLGGSVRLGPGSCQGDNNDNYQCVQHERLTDTGEAYGSDLFEARQAARKDCEENVLSQLGVNCAPHIHRDRTSVYDLEPPKCD